MRNAVGWRLGRQVGLGPLLLSLSLLAVVPILIYGALLLRLMAGQARDATERELRAGALGLRSVVEGDIGQAWEVLKLPAASPGFTEAGDVDARRLASLAERIVQGHFGLRNLALLDAQGRVLFEYPAPAAPPARPAGLEPAQQQALRTGQPVLSGLHPSRVDGALTVSLSLPVQRRDQARWILTADLAPLLRPE